MVVVWGGLDISGIVGLAASLSNGPAIGKLSFIVGNNTAWCHEVIDGLVVVCSQQSTGPGKVPASDIDSAAIMLQVAGDGDSVLVVDADVVSSAHDGGITLLDWHLEYVGSVHHDLGTWEDLELVVTADYSDALLGGHIPDSLVVDDDAEVSIKEVTGQQVAAFSGVLIEVLVKGHEVLAASENGTAYTRNKRHDIV